MITNLSKASLSAPVRLERPLERIPETWIAAFGLDASGDIRHWCLVSYSDF